jgi:hypothetical protein
MISLLPAQWLYAGAIAARSDITARTLEGAAIALRGADVHDLAKSLRGELLLPSAPGYDAARRIWNGMFDNHPALIARCVAPEDVIRAVDFARAHRLLTAVRAGGHSLSGKSTCDGGIVIDVSPMQDVKIDPCHGIARVEGGALLRHLDRAALAKGLVTTTGTVSHTGAAGLTLGGGLGRLGRRFGLACDNLKSVDVVTADGQLLTASDDENADLFWGLRGGGGNFGVATAFEYQLHPMDPTILGGAIAWPISQAEDVLRLHSDLSMIAPDELCLDVAMVSTPDGALIAIEPCWSGDIARGERVLAPLRAFGKPVFDRIAPMRYLDQQSGADGKLAHGIRFYGKSGFVTTLDREAIRRCIDVFESVPPGSFSIVFQHAGGAIGRKPMSATAYPNRASNYWIMISKSWTDPAEDARRLETLRGAWKALEPLTDGFYVNAYTDDQRSRVAANYGPNYTRLQRLKSKFDPDNLFRLNANVLPAGAG